MGVNNVSIQPDLKLGLNDLCKKTVCFVFVKMSHVPETNTNIL